MKLTKFLKRIYGSQHFWPLVLVVVFGILAGKGLIGKGYFRMHDDLQMMRQLEMEKCFLDMQIPCRWVPDMGYGFGFPLFNFYPPLPYLIGEGIRLFGFAFTATAKMLFVIAFVASGVTMYFLAEEFFGSLGGVVASIFYVWAPYHSVDAYVRGAMNESWALIWFPLILLAGYKLLEKSSKPAKWVIILSLGWFALLTSHNLMVLAFGPLFLLWLILWLIYTKAFARVVHLAVAGIFSFGLAAFFTVPALLENKFTHINSVLTGYYDYTAHFPSIKQLLFSRFWGYGPSVWMAENDGMSFQVGHIHWVGSLILLGAIALGWYASKSKKKYLSNQWVIATLFAFFAGWFFVFLTHPRSTAIWRIVTPLRYLQFSWRLLAIIILCFSFVFGAIVKIIAQWTKKKQIIFGIIAILCLGLVVWNWQYFRPYDGKLGPLTDEEKFSGAAWDLQQTAGIYDYLPSDAKEAPTQPKTLIAEVLRGDGEVLSAKQGTNWIDIELAMTSPGVLRIDTFKFPGWEVTVNGKNVDTFVPDYEKWGRMHVDLQIGTQEVVAKFKNTPVRTLANAISLLSWGILISVPIWRKKIGLP